MPKKKKIEIVETIVETAVGGIAVVAPALRPTHVVDNRVVPVPQKPLEIGLK